MPDKDSPGYRDWPSIAQAIKTAAQKAIKDGRADDLGAQITQARFDRFLSRVFADGEDSEWLLKGGTSILARVPRSRSTTDLDLAGPGTDIDEAVQFLQQAAGTDLGDHLRFELTSSKKTGLGNNQPGVTTRRVVFTCLDRTTGRKIGDIPVDVVVGPPPVGTPETITPANRLDLPQGLITHPYRVFPVADQIAEKVCATMATDYPGQQPSSRVKDLVDLVILAKTQHVDLGELRAAVAAKRIASRLPEFTTFRIPEGWSRIYRTLAATTPAADIPVATDAEAFVAQLVNPALRPHVPGEPNAWSPGRGWTEAAELTALEVDPPAAPVDPSEHVRAHIRDNRPVHDYHRRPRSS